MEMEKIGKIWENVTYFLYFQFRRKHRDTLYPIYPHIMFEQARSARISEMGPIFLQNSREGRRDRREEICSLA